QRARLGFDDLCGEDPRDRSQLRITIHQLQIAGQLLHAVDLAAAFDLHGDGDPLRVLGEDVHRTDGCHVLPTHERVPVPEGLDVLGEQLLQVRLDAVLDQAGVDTQVVGGVVVDLVQAHPQVVPVLACWTFHTATTPSAASDSS